MLNKIQEYLEEKANINDLLVELMAAKTNEEMLAVAYKIRARLEVTNIITFDLMRIIKGKNDNT